MLLDILLDILLYNILLDILSDIILLYIPVLYIDGQFYDSICYLDLVHLLINEAIVPLIGNLQRLCTIEHC